MRKILESELALVCGGENPASSSSVSMAGGDQITVKAGPLEYTGSASNFAAGWNSFKEQMNAAGLGALQAISLVEAGFACDFYSNWSVCTDAQGQVDFFMGQSTSGSGGGGGTSGGGGGGAGMAGVNGGYINGGPLGDLNNITSF